MQFLRTMFWVVVAVLGVIFAFNNWTVATIKLWGDIVVDTPLPVLLLMVFLIGLLPPLILHKATRWSLRRKLETANRSLVETRGTVDPVPRYYDSLPPSSNPIAPPPGVS